MCFIQSKHAQEEQVVVKQIVLAYHVTFRFHGSDKQHMPLIGVSGVTLTPTYTNYNPTSLSLSV